MNSKGHLRPFRWPEFWNSGEKTWHVQMLGDKPSHHVQKSQRPQIIVINSGKKTTPKSI